MQRCRKINWLSNGFPLANLKVFQYLHSVQMVTMVNLKEVFNANAVKQRSLAKKECSLKEYFAKTQVLENNAPGQCVTKRNEQNSDSDEKEKRM